MSSIPVFINNNLNSNHSGKRVMERPSQSNLSVKPNCTLFHAVRVANSMGIYLEF